MSIKVSAFAVMHFYGGSRFHGTDYYVNAEVLVIDVDMQMVETKILELLSQREGKTICPSEVARTLEPHRWRLLMPAIRQAAARLRQSGKVVVTQNGKEVDVLTARGPIRLELPN